MTSAKFLNHKDLVRFSIQGTKFITKKSELLFLTQHSDNKILSAILEKHNHKEMLWRANKMPQIYFDRDPVYFRAILRYLKTGKVILDQGMSPELLKEEADFYGLKDPKFAELCNKRPLEIENMEMKMEIKALQKEIADLKLKHFK